MREIIIVFLVLGALLGLSTMMLVPWVTGMTIGFYVMIGGIVVGVPTGIVYHVLLYRALRPFGPLPKGWYWNATKLNDTAPRVLRRAIWIWCWIGAVGFFAIMLGVLMIVLAMVAGWQTL